MIEMARIRTIKPEFPQSESMGAISREARLLFVLLWTLVDDSGRARAASRMLASLLYPYDDDAPRLIEGWLCELERVDCIRRYKVDGATYLEVQNWLKHQKIDRPSKSRFPEPSRALANIREPSSTDLGPRTLDLGPREDGGGGGARAREAPQILISEEASGLADEVAALAGLDPSDPMATPPGWCGASARVQTWLASWSREAILAGVQAGMSRKRDGPPETPKYFEKSIARMHAQISAPVPVAEEQSHVQVSEVRTGWQASRDDFRAARAKLHARVLALEAGSGESG